MNDDARADDSSLEPDNDYDGAWKDLLKSHLSDFLRDYFPSVHERVDWSVDPEWLDKEITQVLPQPGQRSRFVDLLANVRLVTINITSTRTWGTVRAMLERIPVSSFTCFIRFYTLH